MSGFSIAAVRRVGVIGRYHTPGIAAPLLRLAAFLRGRGLEVVIEADTAAHTPLPGFSTLPAERLGSGVDLAIVVGGDGTFLSVARLLAQHEVPLIGINQGRLGFLTDTALSDMESGLAAMFDGRYVLEERMMLRATAHRNGAALASHLALNDVVVNRGGHGSMIDLAVLIGDSYVCDLRADGVIVATPTGSTAYAMSANGPILHPGVRAWSLVPISPHSLTNRPIVIGDGERVTIRVTRARVAAVHWDGHADLDLEDDDSIVIERAPHGALILHPEGYDYYSMLRRKLHWSENPLANEASRAKTEAG